MTDFGNTGTQVTPNVEQKEINMVRDVFERMANAIVGMSEASATIASIKAELESLKAEIEATRARNRELDDMVAHVRRERDEAIRERDEQKRRADDILRNNENTYAELQVVRSDLTNAHEELVIVKRDRDDHGMKVLELEDKLKAAEADLENLRAHRDSMERQRDYALREKDEANAMLAKAKEALGCQ